MITALVLHGLVLVAEDEEIDGGIQSSLLLGVLIQTGLRDVVVIAALHLVLELLQPVVVRPAQGQPGADVGVDVAEQPLVDLVRKYLLQELVAFVAGPIAVAVDHKELLAFQNKDLWLTVELDAQLVVEIAEAPQVVVADEQMDGDAAIGKLGQLALDAGKPFGNHRFVFEPEVEQVAHQEQLLTVVLDGAEKPQQLQFTLMAVLKGGDAQMEVGDEIDGHQNWISVLRRMSSVMRVMSLGSTALTALMTSSWVMVLVWFTP